MVNELVFFAGTKDEYDLWSKDKKGDGPDEWQTINSYTQGGYFFILYQIESKKT